MHGPAVTWDASYFGDSSTLVQIQADFNPSSGEDPTPLDDSGFTSNSLRAGTGSYSWTISESLLNSTTADAAGVDAQLYIVVTTADGGTENRTVGPLFRVVPGNSTGNADGEGDGNGPNLVAIIVPIAIGVLVLLAVVAFLFMKRRNPDWRLASMFGRGKGDGYGSRKSRTERAAGSATGANGVQMGDLGISAPQGGRNVFREEIRRQEEARI